jgi:hypothetical protein
MSLVKVDIKHTNIGCVHEYVNVYIYPYMHACMHDLVQWKALANTIKTLNLQNHRRIFNWNSVPCSWIKVEVSGRRSVICRNAKKTNGMTPDYHVFRQIHFLLTVHLITHEYPYSSRQDTSLRINRQRILLCESLLITFHDLSHSFSTVRRQFWLRMLTNYVILYYNYKSKLLT